MNLDFSKLSPQDFQRLAVAAVRHILGSAADVCPYDPPYGVTDGGFDARIEGVITGVSGPWRLDAKRVANYTAARNELRKVLLRHNDMPLVFVISARVTDKQRTNLVELGRSNTPPVSIVVYDGARLEQALIDHPWLYDWFFTDRREVLLRPVLERGADVEVQRALLRSEAAAVEAALAKLQDVDAVIISGAPRADPVRVLRDIGARAPGLTRFDESAWLDASPHERLPAEVLRALGAAPERTLLLVQNAVVHSALLSRMRDMGVRVALAVYSEDVRDVSARLQGSHFDRIDLEAPSLAEIRDWAVTAGEPEATHQNERLTLWLRSPELLEAWRKDPRLASLWIADRSDPSALAATAWISLLNGPDWFTEPPQISRGRVTIEMLAKLVDGHFDWAQAIESAERQGLIRRTGGDVETWLPVSAGIAALVLGAWYQQRRADDAEQILSSLPLGFLADALAVLCGMGAILVGERICALIGTFDSEGQMNLLLLRPSIWSVHRELLSRALIELRSLLAGEYGEIFLGIIDHLVLSVRKYPELTCDGLALVAAAGRGGLTSRFVNRGVSGLCEFLVDPGQGAHYGDAADGLRWIAGRIREEPDEIHLRMGLSALHVWLRRRIRYEHADELGWSWDKGQWPTHPQVDRGFSAIQVLLSSLLETSDDTWFVALEALYDVDRGEGEGHPTQDRVLQDVMASLLARLSEPELEWYRRSAIEDLLNLVLLHPALYDLRRPWLEAMSAEPMYLLWRFTLQGGYFVAPSERLQAFDSGGPKQVLKEERGADMAMIERRHESFVESLLKCRPGLSELRRLLEDADRAPGRPKVSRGEGRHYQNPALLVIWARREPNVFRSVLAASDWKDWGESANSLLFSILRSSFGNDVREHLRTPPKQAEGYVEEMLAFVRDPSMATEQRGMMFLEILKSATWPETSLSVLHDLVVRCPGIYRAELGLWWVQIVVNKSRLDEMEVDRVLRALLLPPTEAPWPLEDLLARLRIFKEKWPIRDTHREEWILDAFERAYAHAPCRLDNDSTGWVVTLLMEKRPSRFWDIRWEGRDLYVPRDDATIMAVARAAPALDSYESRWAFDLLVRRLGAEGVAGEVRALPPTSDRRLEWLRARGMEITLLEAIVETLESLVFTDMPRAQENARRIASGLGTAGARLMPVRMLSDFPDHPPSPAADPIADAYHQKGEELGGSVGRLLIEMAGIHRRSAADW
ncbi:hypothetical protein OV203_07090 [Nannocystis sp. ILAH1]|uniref:hypothetical protein n=1 Tax=Nannocystis sp. ILAH1 TaxID=2996789 RepID=UPI0022714195|nr:hypothetical protein [Nannocystis sp. ILAH1]MCY0986879.1 hypothetical protein [Nannocystis sp. ILAH1]